jgi:hypothetical protein
MTICLTFLLIFVSPHDLTFIHIVSFDFWYKNEKKKNSVHSVRVNDLIIHPPNAHHYCVNYPQCMRNDPIMRSICAHCVKGPCLFGNICRNFHDLGSPTQNRKYRITMYVFSLHGIRYPLILHRIF